ncbi:MAG TPA: AI-2E family transporter [Nitrospirales bacterium]|nr:AI-2E family transporter [Nitrospirales bacterium]
MMSADRFSPALSAAALAVLLYLLFLIVRPFLSPLGWAAVLAIVLYPMYERLEPRWGPGRSAAATTVAATVLVVGPILLITAVFVHEAIDAAAAVQDAAAEGRFAWVERAWRSLEQRFPVIHRVDLVALVTDSARRSAMLLATQSGSALRNIAGFIFDLVVALFASFFLLRDSRTIMAAVRGLLPLHEPVRERLIGQAREVVSVSVTSSGIIAAVQGLLGGMVFALVGIDAAVFWGVVTGFFCLVPLGAWVIWLPAAVLLAIGGSFVRAVIVAILGFGIVSTVDNVLRPALLSGGTRMNGLLILIALLGGARLFGVLGLVLGPILVVTALALLQTYIVTDGRKE